MSKLAMDVGWIDWARFFIVVGTALAMRDTQVKIYKDKLLVPPGAQDLN